MKIYWHGDSKNIVGERVRIARKKAKLTQADLIAKLQVAGLNFERSSLSRIESGERIVTDYEVVILAKTLNVTLKWLLEGN